MTRSSATFIGFIAILLWALLALLTVGAAPMPPLQLNAICFGIGGVIGLIWVISTGELPALRRISWKVYAFGTAGLFGYHFLYFSALRAAPAVEAGLIAYLWPLLIVLFSGLLPGEHLKRGHVIGGVIALIGAALVIGAAGGDAARPDTAILGYTLAAGCALVWSGYSVLSRRLVAVPTASVAIFCLATAALSTIAHLTFEQTVWPQATLGWISVIGLGLGPVGLAFYVWDIGVKRGDIQMLGVASYAAPLLSTLALIAAGVAAPSWRLLAAAVLISGGARLASLASRA
ncbi:MAG: drug/metabolite transporter (DMT)-like permease [Halocynthiibacter sp.]|jgi:drug/metabolite transporter (DMT)-like permease